MGFYQDHILPCCIDWALDNEACRALRAELCSQLSGVVLEIGFGSGLNLPHLPDAVSKLYALEPNHTARTLAVKRIKQSVTTVELLPFAGEDSRYQIEDASIDMALSSWTLCTVPDVDKTLSELQRVLKPGSCLYFLEHGLAKQPGTARWQRRLTPLQRKIGGGCHLDRDFVAIFKQAKWQIKSLSNFSMPGPSPYSYMYQGEACPI